MLLLYAKAGDDGSKGDRFALLFLLLFVVVSLGVTPVSFGNAGLHRYRS